MKLINKAFWSSFFDENLNSDDYADDIRNVGASSRFTRPDWNIMLTPTVFKQAYIKIKTDQLNCLKETIRRLPSLMFQGDIGAFSQYVGFCNPTVQKYFSEYLSYADRTVLPCRWDIINSSVGWQAIELNTGGALGGFAYDKVQSIYDKIIDQEKNLSSEEKHKEHWHTPIPLLANYIKQRSETLSNPLVVVVDDELMYRESPLVANSIAKALGEELNLTIPVVTQYELESTLLSHKGELITFEVFLASDILRAKPESYHAYFNGIHENRITPVVDLLSELYMSKAIFALLCDAYSQALLSHDEAKAVNALIPETYVVNESLVEKFNDIDHLDWVLKPAIGYGGKDVTCGWEVSKSNWLTLVKDKAQPNADLYIIQKRVFATPEMHISMSPNGTFIESDNTCVLGVFMFDNQYCGGSVRQSLSNNGVINASKNASVGVLRSTYE